MKNIEDIEYKILVDSREQTPLVFTHRTEVVGLYSGDYSASGCQGFFSVERKSLDDLANCCGKDRERFEHELRRVAGCYIRRLMIIGSRKMIEEHQYNSKIEPKSILSTLDCFEIRFNIPVVFCLNNESGGKYIEKMAKWIVREQCKIYEELSK